MLNKEIKKRWLVALRSGLYDQGQSRLRRMGGDGTDKWCCLGVLCDIVDPTRWDIFEAHFGTPYSYGGKEYTTWPPFDTMETIGLPYEKNKLDHPFDKLIEMNDNNAMFKEIADYIEKNL